MDYTEFYTTEDSKELLTTIINSDITVKFGQYNSGTEVDRRIALDKIRRFLNYDDNEALLLLRGIKKSKLRDNLNAKLNSNDSLYDGLFLVGDKAKNFLHESGKTGNPLKNININNTKIAKWIFDNYSELNSELNNAPIDLTYFKNVNNKNIFSKTLKFNKDIFDYYFYGLQTYESNRLVNYVSTTLSPQTALWNEKSNKLIVFLWLPNTYNLYMSVSKLDEYKEKITKLKLPVLSNSFHPKEEEFSLKGFIPPHFIICVHDLDEQAIILNPALLVDKDNWIEDGLHVDQSDFSEFIKTTHYKRYLQLMPQNIFEEKYLT
ncbi:hypothetical protein MKJ04_01655 [Pontibacter sp. E15-1]|uniref:hypothetical protein n=1 Tax=Pontibacter sp. E15-1 TaxID=2919918 RepID=UPI001F501495|nr:hypothetical protein [Pontibacter sp. E15-1]MCJ8163528.1 hypothetical protein [Pontibacter sp. E15-1]